MRETIKDAIGDTVRNLIQSGVKTSFSEKELKELGVGPPVSEFSARDIKKIRKNIKLSQSVFARLLNVSSSSVRKWEQGKNKPSGPTQVLLELLRIHPTILNYRIESSSQGKETKRMESRGVKMCDSWKK